MQRSVLILTDSGGIQEESLSLGKPVLVMRDATERIEAIQTGCVKLIGTNPDRILLESESSLHSSQTHCKMELRHNPYGDGRSSKKIINHILDYDFRKKLLKGKE